MEFDNDRPIKPAYRIEILYWILLAIINPLVNCLTLFLGDPRIWPVLFLVNLIMLPVYLLYAGTIVPKFLLRNRYTAFTCISLLSFIMINVLLFVVYSIILKFGVSPYERSYFTYDNITII